MTLSQDTALSFLLSQHSTEQAIKDSTKVEIVSVKYTDNPTSKPKGIKAKTMPDANASKNLANACVKVDYTLDAKGYLKAIRDSKSRDESIKAMAAYCGYDNRANFGSQFLAAEMKAKRELSGAFTGPSHSEKNAAFRSVQGFTAGMPDNTARQLQHFQGREKELNDSIVEHQKAADDESRSDAERALSQGLADLDREKREHVLADMKRMGF